MVEIDYIPRIIDGALRARLASTGAVLLEGPRACGKTSTARQFANSQVLLDVDRNAREAAAVDPGLILRGPRPRLIDEWQIEPGVWNHVRRAVDESGEAGQFILTGSSVPPDDITRHTGAGRIARLQMRPMTLYEMGHSTGELSLEDMLQGEVRGASESELSIEELARLIARGGWPGLLGRSMDESLQALRDYLEEICRTDISRVDGIQRDPGRVRRLLRSLARNVGTYAAATTLAADVGGADGPLHDDTARDYLDALTRLRVVEDQPSWAPHLRSRSRLRRSPRRHFVDPSLAVAALRATPQRLLGEMNLLGFLFEGLVARDLRVYAQAIDADVYQYRDNTGLEVDAVVEAGDGTWAAFEMKLGQRQVEEAASNLLRFAERVDTERSGAPAILGVIVGTGYGFVRDDGVAVVPIGALGP